MDIKEYIESGVLELYVYDQLSAAERSQVENICTQYPEVQAELDAIQDAMNGYAASHARVPDLALRDKILSQLQFAEAHEPKVIPMNATGSSYRWLAAASVALLSLIHI